MDADVLIVGGGIGGAALALALARHRWSIIVLERETRPAQTVRPEVLAEATFASLDPLGLGTRLRRDASTAITCLEIFDRQRPLVRVGAEDFRAAGAAPRSVDPTLIRAIALESAAQAGTIVVRRGAEVTRLTRDSSGHLTVHGKQEATPFALQARLVVGDDGARSLVRSGLGLPISLQAFPLDFVTARITRPSGFPDHVGRVWLDVRRVGRGLAAAGCLPLPSGDAMLVMPAPPEAWDLLASSEDRLWTELERLTPIADALQSAISSPSALHRFRLAFGHVGHYATDGAVVIGDAAHPMSPAGGQGANAAIADGLALAGIAHAGLSANDLSAERLMEFDRRRRPANARSLEFSERAASTLRVLRRLPGSGVALRYALAFVGRRPAVRQRLLRQVATAFQEPQETDATT